MVRRALRAPAKLVRNQLAGPMRVGSLLPYSIPASGQAVAIGSNTALAVKPSGWSDYAFNYSCFDSFGGGAYVAGYSQHGAYVLAGTGGHNHSDHLGALVFDFSTAQWARLDNANGAALLADPHSFPESATTGSPHYEITGTEVPSPPHAYANLVAMSGGTKGKVAYITRAAICQEARNSSSSHVFDLSTRLWSRMSTTGSVDSEPECDAVMDTTRNVVWLPHTSVSNYSKVKYLDLADNTLKTTAETGNFFPTALAGYYRCWMHDGLLMRNCGLSGLWYFDPSDTTPNWAQCTVTGTLPHVTNRPARHSDGKYYAFRGSAASLTLDRLTPPANPKTGTWVADTVTLSGTQLPQKSGGTEHYTRLFYVPAIDCIAWIAGGSNSVIIFKP